MQPIIGRDENEDQPTEVEEIRSRQVVLHEEGRCK